MDQLQGSNSRHGYFLLNHVRLAFHFQPAASLRVCLLKISPSRMAESHRNRPSNQWVHTVRAAMASDDSRTWFDAKVQEHGFDFLDDYLDRILAQAKQPQLVAFICLPRHPTYVVSKTHYRARQDTRPEKKPANERKIRCPVFEQASVCFDRLHRGMNVRYNSGWNLPCAQEPETEDDQTLPPNTFAQALIDAGNEEDTFSRPIPPSAQLVVPEAANARLSPVDEVSYQAEQVVESTSRPTLSIKPLSVPHSNVRPPSPEPEPRQEDIIIDEPANGAPLSPPASPMIMSPDLPSKKALPTPPDDDEVQVTGERHPPPATSSKSVEKPAVVHDVFKSPPPQPKPPLRSGPLRTLHTAGNPDLNPKTAPLPASTTNIFTPLPPPTDIPGTRLMRKASAPQLQPNVPLFARDPVSQPTPALPKRTSWLTKAREVHQEAKALTHTKRTDPHPGLSESTSTTTNHLTKSTKRKPSEIFDGVAVPPRHSGKVQKVTETDVQTNANREQYDKEMDEKDGQKEEEKETDSQETRSDIDILDEEDPLHTLKRTVEGLGSRAGKSMGKSIGGLAAAALAEARATAEARIAEKTEKFTVIDPKPKEPEPQQSEEKESGGAKLTPQKQPSKDKSPIPQPANARASLHNKERVFQPPSQADVIKLKAQKDDVGKSNDSAQPTRSILKPPPVHQPVFSKPVFTAPKPKPSSKPPAVTNVGIQPSFSSTNNSRLDDAPAPTAWLLENQESRDRDNHSDHTAFSTALYDTRNDLGGPGSDLDEGDSWHDGDKLNPIWSALNFDGAQRDDEMTWSTIPTQNHTSSTQGFHTTNTQSSAGTGHKSAKSREEKEKDSLEILGLATHDAPLSPPKEEKALEEVREPPIEEPHEIGVVLMEVDESEEPVRAGLDKVGIFPSHLLAQ